MTLADSVLPSLSTVWEKTIENCKTAAQVKREELKLKKEEEKQKRRRDAKLLREEKAARRPRKGPVRSQYRLYFVTTSIGLSVVRARCVVVPGFAAATAGPEVICRAVVCCAALLLPASAAGTVTRGFWSLLSRKLVDWTQ